jgi:hypothetical protein
MSNQVSASHVSNQAEVGAYKQPVSSTSSTIGELISWKRASNENN